MRGRRRSTSPGLAADSRKVKPAFCSSRSPAPRPTARISPSRRSRPARWRSWPSSGRTGLPHAVAFVQVDNARRALALAAAKFYPRQPQTIAAVTGTSGKTSVAAFTRQIWSALGLQAASIGTVGVVSPKGEIYGSLTTPDPVELHRTLDQLAGEGVTHLALEASSHGLDQHRLDGVRIAAGAFTNLSRDHLDYHPTIEAYLAAKLRLFERSDRAGRHRGDRCRRLLCGPGGRRRAQKRGLKVMTVGEHGERHPARRRRHRRLRAGGRHRSRRPHI